MESEKTEVSINCYKTDCKNWNSQIFSISLSQKQMKLLGLLLNYLNCELSLVRIRDFSADKPGIKILKSDISFAQDREVNKRDTWRLEVYLGETSFQDINLVGGFLDVSEDGCIHPSSLIPSPLSTSCKEITWSESVM